MVTSRFFSGWVISRLHSYALSFISLIFCLAYLASGTQASATKVAAPTFSPAAGTYTGTQMVSISDSTSGASIYYTTNGSTPTTASTPYSSAITVSVTETLKAIGTHSGDTNSSVGSAKYTIQVATPTFSPGAGTYTATQTVTISDTTSGANIYYTTNGSTPTTASTHYTSPVTVSVSQTLKALATHTGDTNSAVGSAVYTIQVATPTFSPGGGVYSSGQTVTISDTTSGANIYYTTNGSTPTTASTHYTSPVSVSVSQTLEAIATHSGDTNSAVRSAAYTIGSGGTPIMTVQHNSGSSEDSDALAVSFTSNVTSENVILIAESTYDAETLATPTDMIGNTFTLLVTAGTSGDSVAAVYAATNKSSGADTVTCNDNDASNNLHCNIYEVQGITTTVDKTGNSTLTSTAQTVSTSAATSNAVDFVFAFFSDNANGANITVGPGYGDTELSNDGGDSGFSEDAVVVATGVQTATATSSLADADVNVIVALETTGTATISTPTFSPSPGTYIYAQTVTISDWTSGSTIYYTTNGTTPTTNSTK